MGSQQSPSEESCVGQSEDLPLVKNPEQCKPERFWTLSGIQFSRAGVFMNYEDYWPVKVRYTTLQVAQSR